jgi:hypothetical protein
LISALFLIVGKLRAELVTLVHLVVIGGDEFLHSLIGFLIGLLVNDNTPRQRKRHLDDTEIDRVSK